MGAPKGNEFWKLRAKHGRDKLFKDPESLWEACCEYFEWCVENPLMDVEQSRKAGKKKVEVGERGLESEDSGLIDLPKPRPFILSGLCVFLGVNTKYFSDFQKDCSKEFSEVISRVRDIIYTQKFSAAASGLMNANLISRDLGLIDKVENSGEMNMNVNIKRNVIEGGSKS